MEFKKNKKKNQDQELEKTEGSCCGGSCHQGTDAELEEDEFKELYYVNDEEDDHEHHHHEPGSPCCKGLPPEECCQNPENKKKKDKKAECCGC